MERIGESIDGKPLIEFLDEVPCPTEGCTGMGRRVRLLTTVLVVPCDPCNEAAEARELDKERQEDVDRLLARAGGTERMRPFTFESYFTDGPGREALAAVAAWRDEVAEKGRGARNLYLYGNRGAGKTGLMWPVVKSLCEQMIPAKIVDFPSLLEQMRQASGKHVPFHEFSDIGLAHVLVLDDIGAERPTEWTLGQLHHLVNTRYERCLPTAYISNYAPDDLVERLTLTDPVIAERIVSRMTESDSVIQYHIKARDRRRSA